MEELRGEKGKREKEKRLALEKEAEGGSRPTGLPPSTLRLTTE
jgi:hypothetical protein